MVVCEGHPMRTRRLKLSPTALEDIGRWMGMEDWDDNALFVDLLTGELVAWEESSRKLAAMRDVPKRYLEIPKMGPERGRLRQFVRGVVDPELRDACEALSRGRGAYRRVKDHLHAQGELGLWHAFEEEAERRRARAWLADEGVELLANGQGGPDDG